MICERDGVQARMRSQTLSTLGVNLQGTDAGDLGIAQSFGQESYNDPLQHNDLTLCREGLADKDLAVRSTTAIRFHSRHGEASSCEH